ncbi:hypothetical protein BDB00DRAFT_925865 [Zychaea mexicana]|uniref:uncharacterized protein n=1 Tax=Zychaea mexicana TaxID=64656 RepID=UPI0022FEE8D8|nr:uncharacterized protein BDB00DRAFT_925865 [Zychaea mexicana]KAI9497347.1 hypothetical protein BDB00DRAFT_925865 [Zychaea mexicana]
MMVALQYDALIMSGARKHLKRFKYLVNYAQQWLHSAVFKRCLFGVNSNILGLLRMLSVNLVELAFLQHRANMPFITTIAACPKLVQFSYSVDNGFRGIHYADICTNEPATGSDGSNSNNGIVFPAMTCLSIDATLAHRQRLGSILSKCPNLAVLRLNNSYVSPPFDLLLSGQLDLNMRDIFVRCPKLEYLAYNSSPSSPRPDVEGWMAGYRKNKKTKQIKNHEISLEALTISAGVSDARMNWDALETVHALQLRTTYQPVFHALHIIPKLKRLTIDYRFIDQLRRQELRDDDVMSPLCDWLEASAACHDTTTDGFIALQELHVIGPVALNILHNRLLDALCSVTTLKTLELNNVNNVNHPDERFQGVTNNENLSTEESLHVLQKLAYLSVEKLFLVKVTAFCKELFDILSSMKHLRILEIVSSSGLYHIDDLVNFIKIPFDSLIMRDRHER